MTNKPARERDVVAHARKLRADLSDELPNGVGNTIDALCELLEAPSPQPDTDVVDRLVREAHDKILNLEPCFDHAHRQRKIDRKDALSVVNRLRADLRATAALNASTPEIQRMREALAFYANPEVYKPHPHGPAFDRRDLSYIAIAALKQDEENHDR